MKSVPIAKSAATTLTRSALWTSIPPTGGHKGAGSLLRTGGQQFELGRAGTPEDLQAGMLSRF